MRLNDKPSPRGILFDMDGVLLTTNQSASQSWREVAQQFAPRLAIPVDTLVQALQKSHLAYKREIEYAVEKQRRDRLEPFETRQETVASALKALNRESKDVAAEMVQAFEALHHAHRQLTPHALELLEGLRKGALPLALITNGNATYQRGKLAQFGLTSFFDTILIEEEFGVEKPHQRLFLSALDELHVGAHEAWMIGDDLARDIAGAQQVGIFAIWYDFAKRGLPDNIRPDWIIHDLLEVRDALIL